MIDCKASTRITKIFVFSLGCQGGDTCCTPDNKCGEDEGDCDSDNDCQEGLKCGVDNCSNKGNANPKPFPNNEWDATDDCCYKPAKGKRNLWYLGCLTFNKSQRFDFSML